MRTRTKTVFLSADHLDEQAEARAREAEEMPAGEARQNALLAAAQLRSYAQMKRILLTPKGEVRKTGQSRVRRI